MMDAGMGAVEKMFRGVFLTSRRIRNAALSIAVVLLALIGTEQLLFAQSTDALSQVEQVKNALQSTSSSGDTSSGNDNTSQSNTILQPSYTPKGPAISGPPSRLEQIMSNRAGVTLRLFGYDYLGAGGSVVVPQVGAVRDDYILGPGDEIVVSLRGQENSEYRERIDRNGQITLPRISPILAAGRTLGEFRQDVADSVRRAYISTQSFVTLGQLRQISVVVAGEVNSPGVRLMTGLSSPLDAILLSGGIKKTGSLRDVKLIHGDRQITIDFYSFLTQHGVATNVKLTDGDRIIVPTLGPTVGVSGWLRRPGIYELAPGTTAISVRQAISLAGGLEIRGRYRLSALRFDPDGSSRLAALSSEVGTLRDSEILFALPAADQINQSATFSGNTPLAGRFAVGGATSLSQVLKEPGALGKSPYALFGLIVRRDSLTKAISLIPFTPSAILEGRQDIALDSHDLLRIFTAREALLMSADIGEFKRQLDILDEKNRAPLEFATTDPSAGSTGTSSANTTQNTALSGDALSERQIVATISPKTLGPGGVLSDRLPTNEFPPLGLTPDQNRYLKNAIPPVSLGNNMVADQENGQIPNTQNPNQALPQVLPSSDANLTSYFAHQNPINSNSPSGPTPSTTGGFTLSDVQPSAALPSAMQRPTQVNADNLEEQSVSGDEFPSNLEIETIGQLARQLGVDSLVLIHFMTDNCIIVRGSVFGGGYYLVGPGATVHDLVTSIGGVSNQTDVNHFELISNSVSGATGTAAVSHRIASLEDPAIENFELHPRDEIRFNPVDNPLGAGTVTLQGQVHFPGVYNIERGERLSELLLRAGGLTDVSYPYGTVFLRRSVAEAEHEGNIREANEVQNIIASGLSRIGGDRISPDAFSALASFAGEIRDAPALGRVSVVADPVVLAANPSRDPLLEAGDVVYIPQRPSTVTVLGQVNQPGTRLFSPNETVDGYIEKAGGYGPLSDKSETFVILPDGTARKADTSWLSFGSGSLPPGTTIVVQRDVAPLDTRQLILDMAGILQSLAVSAASLAVLHNN